MRIALIAPPFISVPPKKYGGTELFLGHLAEGLEEQGIDVVVYASGDSTVKAELRSLYPESQWPIKDEIFSNMKDVNHTAWAVADAMIATIKTLPEALRRSLTWDQGHEMLRHARISFDADIDIYFCDPHSPWQRGSNENTNGLLRQYFPKGTDVSGYTQRELDAIARRLNTRPRQTLDFRTPAEVLHEAVALTG